MQQYFDPTQPPQRPTRHLNSLLVPFILTVVLLIAMVGFGAWAFVSRQDYKDHSDKKSAQAVAVAEKALDAKKEADFAEREKEPYKTYTGPATFGTVSITFAKTWSAYITENARGNVPIDGYLHPNYVPGQSGTAYALHFQVLSSAYDQELKKYDSDVKGGKVKVSPVVAPKVTSVTGVRIEGEVETGKQGVTLLFPLRDKTLKITTESTKFVKDLDKAILPNLTFVP